MTQPTEMNPSVLAQSVLGLLMRSGRQRGEGLGRTMEVEQESGEAMTFTMLASNALDAAHVARVRVWLDDRLVLDLSLIATMTIMSSTPSTKRDGRACCSRRLSSTKMPRARQDQITKGVCLPSKDS
jgi:hypothetical protein